jgi:hypothetical protein
MSRCRVQVLGQQMTLLELIAGHRSLLAAGLDLPRLAGLLPRLAPRYYSISSSPAAPGGPSRWVHHEQHLSSILASLFTSYKVFFYCGQV